MRSDGWTILRPGFFTQNLGDAYRQDIVERDRIYVPAGRGRVAFVDVRDLADVAAMVFAHPSVYERHGYTLTGAEAVDFMAVAASLSQTLGRPIRYDPASVWGYVHHLRRRGLPWAQLAVQTVLHLGVRFGQAAQVDSTLEQLLQRRPRTVRDYVQDHRVLWKASISPR